MGIPIVIKLNDNMVDKDGMRMSAISASYNDDGEGVLVHEVKRVGFLIDRYVDLQLRIGDSLVVYLQRASAWGLNLKKTSCIYEKGIRID